MRICCLFLLVYVLRSCCEATDHHSKSCERKDGFEGYGSTLGFLQCVGLPSSDTGKDHIRNLKDILEAMMDLYTFMRSAMKGVPVLGVEGALDWTPHREFENEDLVKMWLEIKIKPLLKSITKQFLSCLSTKNFTCSSYQTAVKQLSSYYSEMDPVRQKWIYTFFMYPVLSGENMRGCVMHNESSEDWLIKNFGYFKVMARFSDFSKLNVGFSGFEVLHLLTSTQTAELVLLTDFDGLSGDMEMGIIQSLSSGNNHSRPGGPGRGGPPQSSPEHDGNYTSMTKPVYQPPSQADHIRGAFNELYSAFKPVGRFVHEFVSLTHKRKESEIGSAVLTQFALNFTLAEMANMYKPREPEKPTFDVLNVEHWYEQVVMPLLRRLLPQNTHPLDKNIKLAFEEVFYLDHDMHDPDPEIEDVCSMTLMKNPCVMTDTVKNIAQVLHCSARAKVTLDEGTVVGLIQEMLRRLNLVLEELARTDFSELAEEIREIFTEDDSQSLTEEHLNDPEFSKLWFKVKLMPMLPDLSVDLLSCLGSKNFSCPVYHTIVGDLSRQMKFMDADPKHSQNIYRHFIFSFLYSTSKCWFDDSSEWLRWNFDYFSRFAKITEFYELNADFDPVSAVSRLTLDQLVQLVLWDLPTPAGRRVPAVFDYLLKYPQKLQGFLEILTREVRKGDRPCSAYKLILEHLYELIPDLPPDTEQVTRTSIEELINALPQGCVSVDIACPVTRFNAAKTCRDVDSSILEEYLKNSEGTFCDFTLEEFACAELQDFSAEDLVSLMTCDLPGPSNTSKVLWKMVLTKTSLVLDPALNKLAKLSTPVQVPAAAEILDLIGEMRLARLTEDQLKDSSVIRDFFSGGVRVLLPSASAGFYDCLSRRNLSCETFQDTVEVLSGVDGPWPERVTDRFILSFLSRPDSGQGCSSGLDSLEWLKKNFDSFSGLVTLEELLQLNPDFQPLNVLPHLTPEQLSEMFLVLHPNIPENNILIDSLFDFFRDNPDEEKFERFLFEFVKQVEQMSLTCSDFRALFTRLDKAMDDVSPGLAEDIVRNKREISKFLPAGCVIYEGTCRVTPVEETEICAGVDSSSFQLHLDSWNLNGDHCGFSVEEVACAKLQSLEADDLVDIMTCNRSSNASGSRAAWKLLLTKAEDVLDESLDLLNNKMLDPDNPAVSKILDAIQELRSDFFSLSLMDEEDFTQKWFNRKLRPFLASASPDFLSCLATSDFNCTSYWQIVRTLSQVHPSMTFSTEMSVYNRFLKNFLTRNNSADPGCRLDGSDSGDWLVRNLGSFSGLADFSDLQMLRGDFSGLEALPHLTRTQLGQMCATPGQIRTPGDVAMVMSHVPDEEVLPFFVTFSDALTARGTTLSPSLRSAWLRSMFVRGKLTEGAVSDEHLHVWMALMNPLMDDLSSEHVVMFFQMLDGRSCEIEKNGMAALDSKRMTMSQTTVEEIHQGITKVLQGENALRCMKEGESFYKFLKAYYMSFGFPSLSMALSFIPPAKMNPIVNSMPLTDLGDFLRRPGVVDSHEKLCDLYTAYKQTPEFLEQEPLPEELDSPTASCVWPRALGADTMYEADVWKRAMGRFLKHLSADMVGPDSTDSASCFGFQMFVACLGSFDFTEADFHPENVSESITNYLSSSAPKCYDPSHSDLNSTTWFLDYIGVFIPYVTVSDLLSFGSETELAVFAPNSENIALIDRSEVSAEVLEFYTYLIYAQESEFSVRKIPTAATCYAPGYAFLKLNMVESEKMLGILRAHCGDVNSQIMAALAGNYGNKITADIMATLGKECRGLPTGTLRAISVSEIFKSRLLLGTVSNWNIGQARAIMKSLMKSGLFRMDGASLTSIGTLVKGITGSMMYGIGGSDLLTASESPTFITNLIAAPEVVRFIAIGQIIGLNRNSEQVLTNVPDELASEIPRPILRDLLDSKEVNEMLNNKIWKKAQAELFFAQIGSETSTGVLGSEHSLSSSVLQGFTCTSVSTFEKTYTKKLIKACRRENEKVKLVESQLTCMYNYIKGEPDVTSYESFPEDMLLYYDYSLVPQATCREYFKAISGADFSVFSSTLSYMRDTLVSNAKKCLSITSTEASKDDVEVLGNMCCYMDGSFIQSSDPYILEMLKNCEDLTEDQAAAVESLLVSGKTSYGDPQNMMFKTLKSLGMLPMYLSPHFYGLIPERPKRKFLKYFLKVLRDKGVKIEKKRTLKRDIKSSNRKRSRRAVGSDCVLGEITYVDIISEEFPTQYPDVEQFDACITAAMVNATLAEIIEKMVEEDYLKVVLGKVYQVYPSTVPEKQVVLLGPASRVATAEQVNRWTITEIDTLAALMYTSDGDLDSDMALAIITKYLSVDGNKLRCPELNVIRGTNLCSLPVDVLQNIEEDALRDAEPLDIVDCTQEKKKVLFLIALRAFSAETRTTVSQADYLLTRSYLGGASTDYIKSMSGSDVNMDVQTFSGLDPDVLMEVTVDEVRGLLGKHLPDLERHKDDPGVLVWIRNRYQVDLDRLGLRLTGGKASPTTSKPPTTVKNTGNTKKPATVKVTGTKKPATVKVTANKPDTTKKPSSTSKPNDGGRVRADVFFLLALVLLARHLV